MAKEIPQFSQPIRRRTRWDDLLNGRIWQITKGEDFTHIEAFRGSAYQNAKKRGMKVTVVKISEDIYEVQAVKVNGQA